MNSSTSFTSADKDGELYPDEIRIWVGEKEKSIRGLSAQTSCSDIVHSLLKHSKLANVKTLQSHAIYQKWPEYQIQLKGHTKILEEFKRCQDVNIAVTFHMQKLPSTPSLGGMYSNTSSANLAPSPCLNFTLPHGNSGGPESQRVDSIVSGHKSRSETSLINKHSSRRGQSSTGGGQQPKEGQKVSRSKRNSSCHSVLRQHASTDTDNNALVKKQRRRSEGDNYKEAWDSDSSVDVKRKDVMSRKIRSLKYRRHATSLLEIQSGKLSVSRNHTHLTDQRPRPENSVEHYRERNNHVDKTCQFSGTIVGNSIRDGGGTNYVTNNGIVADEAATKIENLKDFTTLAIDKKNNKNNNRLVYVGCSKDDENGMVIKPSQAQRNGGAGVKIDSSNNKSCHRTDEQIEKMNLYCKSNIGDIKNGAEKHNKNHNQSMNGEGGNSISRSQNVSPLFEARNRRRRKNSSKRSSRQTSNLLESEYFRYKQNVEMQQEELSELQQRIENVEKQIIYITQSTIVSNESSLDNTLNQSQIRSQQNAQPRSQPSNKNRNSKINLSPCKPGFTDNYYFNHQNQINKAAEITRIYEDIQAVQRKLDAQNFLGSKLETELDEMKRKYVCPKCQIVYRNSKCLCSVLEELEQSKNRTQSINKESSYVESQINQVEQDIMKHTMRIQRLEYEIDFYSSKASSRTGRVPLRGIHPIDVGSKQKGSSRNRVRSVDAVLDKKLTRAHPIKTERVTRKRNETDSDTGLGSLSTEEDLNGVQLVVAKTTQIVI